MALNDEFLQAGIDSRAVVAEANTSGVWVLRRRDRRVVDRMLAGAEFMYDPES